MLKLVLTISNGQTVLEGVISHRKAILSENMLFVSIVSKRISKDILVSKKLEPHFIIAEKKLSESKERLDYKNLFDIGQRVTECVSNAEK